MRPQGLTQTPPQRGTGRVFLIKQTEKAEDEDGDSSAARAAEQAEEEARIEVLVAEKVAVDEEVRGLLAELSSLKAEPTNAELIEREKRLTAEVGHLRSPVQLRRPLTS